METVCRDLYQENKDPRADDKERDKLGGGQGSYGAPFQIPPEKFHDKTSGPVQDQIQGGHLAVFFCMPGSQDQDEKMHDLSWRSDCSVMRTYACDKSWPV